MNMRIERNVIQPALDSGVDSLGKTAPKGKVGADSGLTVEHVQGGDHRGGLGPLGIDELMPPPKPNALDALQPMFATPATPATPASPGTPGTPATPATPAAPATPTDNQNSDFITKVGSPSQNSVAAAMLEIGLAEIQSDQTMAKSQDDARKSDLASYSAKIDDAVTQLQDQAHNEVQQAWIEGVVGGVGAALSVAGAVGGAYAAAEDAQFPAKLLGGTEMGAGLLSTTGGLFGTLAQSISKGTAGKAEIDHQGDQKRDEKEAAIFQSAQGAAQEYRDKYWDMQEKALSAVQAVIQGQGQAGQSVASNV